MNNGTPEQETIPPETPAEISTSQPAGEPGQERHRSRRGMGSGAWVGGAVLIIVGIYLLMQNFGFVNLTNWWALFILIPAVGALSSAWRAYQNAGGVLTGPARSSLFGGLILTMIAVIFLFNLSWNWLGPMILILLGVGLLTNNFLPKR